MKIFNMLSLFLAGVGGFISHQLGGYDILLDALIYATVIDWITALTKAGYNKELSSKKGFFGIGKVIVMFALVGLAYKVSVVTDKDIRSYVIMFFFVNQALSSLENASVFLKIPVKFKEMLIQVRGD